MNVGLLCETEDYEAISAAVDAANSSCQLYLYNDWPNLNQPVPASKMDTVFIPWQLCQDETQILRKLWQESEEQCMLILFGESIPGDVIRRAFHAGANGYVPGQGPESIVYMIHAISLGLTLARPSWRLHPANETATPGAGQKILRELTHRENQILSELLQGNTPNGIARLLCISVHTVRQHTKNIYSKLGVKGRSGLLKTLYSTGAVVVHSE